MVASIVWMSLPVSTATTGSVCTLTCCAGRAPHAAGSCMNGSCHAVLNRARSHAHQPVVNIQEQLCGLPRPTARLPQSRRTHTSGPGLGVYESRSSKSLSECARLASSALDKPCASDCGAGTFSSTNQRRPREAAALLLANRNRAPSGPRLATDGDTAPHLRDARHTLASPRGPPTPIS